MEIINQFIVRIQPELAAGEIVTEILPEIEYIADLLYTGDIRSRFNTYTGVFIAGCKQGPHWSFKQKDLYVYLNMNNYQRKRWYSNGQIAEDYIKTNILSTKHKWYENGNCKLFGNWNSAGSPEGMQRDWYPNGQLKSERSYTNGKLTGSSRRWYSNGQLKYKAMHYAKVVLYA